MLSGTILKSRILKSRILKIIKRHIKYTKDNTFQDFEYILNFFFIVLVLLLKKNEEPSNNTVVSLVFILTIYKARFIQLGGLILEGSHSRTETLPLTFHLEFGRIGKSTLERTGGGGARVPIPPPPVAPLLESATLTMSYFVL